MQPGGTLPCAQEPRSIQSTPSHPIYLKTILMLSSHLFRGLPSFSYMKITSIDYTLFTVYNTEFFMSFY
jgi:hypothetical protein